MNLKLKSWDQTKEVFSTVRRAILNSEIVNKMHKNVKNVALNTWWKEH